MAKTLSPRQKITGFSQDVADLVLLYEDSAEWVAEPKVRRSWHWLFFSVISLVAFNLIILQLIQSLAPETLLHSEHFALIQRTFLAFTYAALIVMLIRLAHAHFFYLILTGKDLRVRSIGLFFITGIVLFAQLHFHIYLLSASNYAYSTPPQEIQSVITPLGIVNRYRFLLDFLVYSAGVTL